MRLIKLCKNVPTTLNFLIAIMNKLIVFFKAENATWTIIGKISSLLALVIAIAAVKSLMFPSEPELQAICRISKVPYHQEVPRIKGVPEDINKPALDKGSEEAKIMDAVSTALEAQTKILAWISEKHYLACEISNIGNQEAKDVVLDVPYHMLSAYSGFTRLNLNEIERNSVGFGTMRPKQKIQAAIWTNDGYAATSFTEDDYVLSYSGGVGELKLPYYAYGWTAKIAKQIDRFSKDPLSMTMLIVSLVALITSIALLIKLRPSTRKPQK